MRRKRQSKMASTADTIEKRIAKSILPNNTKGSDDGGGGVIPHPTCSLAPWPSYYKALACDMVNLRGLFSNSVIHWRGAKQPNGIKISRADWDSANRHRPPAPIAIRDFFRTEPTPIPSATIPSSRSCNYAVLNSIADLSGSTYVASPSNVHNIFDSNLRSTLFNFEAIAKHPMIHTSTAQLAVAEFFMGITDLNFNYAKRLTGISSHKKLIITSKTLRNLAGDCYKAPDRRRSDVHDAGFHFCCNVTKDIADLFRFLCSTSYSVSKNDPNYYAAPHEIEQVAFLESGMFHYMQRVASIVKIGTDLVLPRKLWEDDRTNFVKKAALAIQSSGSLLEPSAKTQCEHSPRPSDNISALDIHSINSEILEFMADLERYQAYSKVAPLCHIGVLLSARRLVSKFAKRLRTSMAHTMMPTPNETRILQGAKSLLAETPQDRKTRQRLEATRKSSLLMLSNQYKQKMSQMIYRLFTIYLEFAITMDPLRPQVHMAALFSLKARVTDVPSEMPDEYVDLMKMLYKRALDDNYPAVEKSLWFTNAYSIPKVTAPNPVVVPKPHVRLVLPKKRKNQYVDGGRQALRDLEKAKKLERSSTETVKENRRFATPVYSDQTQSTTQSTTQSATLPPVEYLLPPPQTTLSSFPQYASPQYVAAAPPQSYSQLLTYTPLDHFQQEPYHHHHHHTQQLPQQLRHEYQPAYYYYDNQPPHPPPPPLTTLLPMPSQPAAAAVATSSNDVHFYPLVPPCNSQILVDSPPVNINLPNDPLLPQQPVTANATSL
jgi:hypothetical protein